MANPLSNNPVAAFGEATRLTELRRRFLFLIGGLIVYRIGTFGQYEFQFPAVSLPATGTTNPKNKRASIDD